MTATVSPLPSLRHVAIIASFALLLMAPACLLGPGGIDLHTQTLWVRHFSAQFWGGELYPRWLQGMFAGDGSPVFFYYPPLAYFITALFEFPHTGDFFGYGPLIASALCALFVSGVTFYAWIAEEGQDPRAALMGSLLYMTALNHVADDFYQLLLFSSVWAYAWVPLLMLFAKRLAQGGPYSLFGFAFFLAFLVLTNIPMTVLFGPLAVGYSLMHFPRRRWYAPAIRLCAAVLLGFGLSAIYLLPAVMYMGFASVDLHWRDIGSSNIWSGSQFLSALIMCFTRSRRYIGL